MGKFLNMFCGCVMQTPSAITPIKSSVKYTVLMNGFVWMEYLRACEALHVLGDVKETRQHSWAQGLEHRSPRLHLPQWCTIWGRATHSAIEEMLSPNVVMLSIHTANCAGLQCRRRLCFFYISTFIEHFLCVWLGFYSCLRVSSML